ncbi:SURF1 family protein [Cellulomonas sp. DKR-3]|uniref:SURF1-like protein n=1 Tax=Cellulomonas fulva TaxID=2835530 RepID=A0ABS5U1P2_9CELL|nr:SURF1 family protein [Cellulomonas fulva]MBT0995295.1 SURF1 family protein [Cellulomonas fulva]
MTLTPARRRAVGLVLVGVVVATVCVFLGRWQWHRHEWRDAQIAIAESNYDADPVPLDQVVDGPADALPDDEQWRPVTVTGHYLDATVLLRNRPVDGNPAYHVVVPFVVAGTQDVLVVDRGWVPTGEDASESVEVPAAPAGQITLVVRLRTAENPSSRAPGDGWVHALAPGQVLTAADAAVPGALYTGLYGQRVSEDPAPAQVPGALPPPDLDPGSHLSYAFQWWVFSLGALLGFCWLARREVVEERDGPLVLPHAAPRPDEPADTPVSPAPRRRRKEGRAEAEEDALIEAQLGTPPDR